MVKVRRKFNFAGMIMVGLAMLLYCSCKGPESLSRSQSVQLDRLITESDVFQSASTGFLLMEPESGHVMYEDNAHKYFTPASNIKIFTLYTALEILGDSIPLFHYMQSGDTLYIKASGGPSITSPHFNDEKRALDLLRKGEHRYIGLLADHYLDERFGPGWAWDGYRFNYQAERSPITFYGNRIKLTFFPNDTVPRVHPAFFENRTEKSKVDLPGRGSLLADRKEFENQFYYSVDGGATDTLERLVPFRVDRAVVSQLFSELSGKEVFWSEEPENKREWKTLYSTQPDSLYRRMMLQSDNFIAEQLLLSCSGVLYDTLLGSMAIRYAVDSLFFGIPDRMNWWDGSGMSRYNMTTPANTAFALRMLYQKMDFEELIHYFPAGGRTGTLRDWYGGEPDPWIYAKTGTLRNHHSLSGFLKGKSGRVFIFSFMHNNFSGASFSHREEMNKVLYYLHQQL